MSDTRSPRQIDPEGYAGTYKNQLDEALERHRQAEGYILTLEKRLAAQSALIQQLQKDNEALRTPAEHKPDQPVA